MLGYPILAVGGQKKRAGVVLGFVAEVWAVGEGEKLSKTGAETPTSSPG